MAQKTASPKPFQNGSQQQVNTSNTHNIPLSVPQQQAQGMLPQQQVALPLQETPRQQCMRNIRRRALWTQLVAGLDLFLIFLGLLNFHTVYSLADSIARMEAGYVEDMSRSAQERGELKKVVDATKRMETKVRDADSAPSRDAKVDAVRKAVDEYSGELAGVNLVDAPPPISTAQLAIQTASSWLTRFGILACALFLLHLLVLKFRFNTRLAVQYEAVADALMLMPEDQQLDFNSLLPAITPRLDFGSVPKVLIEHAADVAVRGAEIVHKKSTPGT